MEIVLSKKQLELQAYSKNEYIAEREKVQADIVRVLSSYEASNQNYEYDAAIEQINDLTTDLLIDDFVDARFYVLFNKLDNTPVSFVIFTHDSSRETWHLEYICTHSDFAGMGLGEILMRESAKHLREKGVNQITSVIEKENIQSLSMHYAFANHYNVKFYQDELDDERFEFLMDISKINEEKKSVEDVPTFD